MKRSEQFYGTIPHEAVSHDELLLAIERIEVFAHETLNVKSTAASQLAYKERLVGVGADLFEVVAAIGVPFQREVDVYIEEDEEVYEFEVGLDFVDILGLTETGDVYEQRFHSRMVRLITGHKQGVIQATVANQILTKRINPRGTNLQQVLTHSLSIPLEPVSWENTPGWSMWTMDKSTVSPFSYPQDVETDIQYIKAWQKVAQVTAANVTAYLV